MAAFRTLKRWLAPAVVSGVAVTVAACGGPKSPGGPAGGPGGPAAPVEVGSPLYPTEKMPAAPASVAGAEPIVLSQAIIQFDEKITLAAQVDGEIEMIAKPLPSGKYDPKDPRYQGRLIPRPRDKTSMHIRLMDGDPIREGEMLAFLDDSQVTVQLEGLKKSLDTAKAAAKEGDDSVEKIQDALKIVQGLPNAGRMEVIQYQVQVARTKVDQGRTKVDLVRYESEYAVTFDKRQRHYIFSPVNGRVVRIVQFPGQFVKAGEPVLEVQNTSRFRVEAKVDRQEADRVKQYTPVLVEPVRSLSPEPYTARHRQEVTGVAVTAHPGRPLVVSASNDGTALVWNVTGDKKQHVLPHPTGTGVRCVAATTGKGKDGPHLIATGGSDGRVRLWDVTNPAQLPDKPAAEFEETHSQGLTAAAFSPDGRYLATAAGRDVFVWDVGARKKKYALPGEHKDDVKALRFTPQGTLVTACRDRSVRVWTVGTDGATVARSLDHRSGAVDVVGVSGDGGRVLFDQEATRVDVVSLADGRTTGSLLNAAGGTRFATFALFSADDQFVLTGAGEAEAKGEMQLWAAIGGGRGSERRRLVTQGRAAVTCAAFSPDPANKFVAVGTQTGAVHFWMLPEVGEASTLRGRVVSVLPNDARTAQVRVEVENPDGKLTDLLQDRGAATVIIDPTAKPEPPALPASPAEPPPLRPVPGGAGLTLPPLPTETVPAGGTGK